MEIYFYNAKESDTGIVADGIIETTDKIDSMKRLREIKNIIAENLNMNRETLILQTLSLLHSES